MRKILLISLAFGCLSAQECSPCWEEPTLNAGYNFPANLETCNSWNMWVNASFLYWQPIEENIDPAAVVHSEFTTILPLPTTPSVSNDLSIVSMDFKFKPGFQVAIGFNPNYDHWDLEAEYTRFHSHQKKFTSGQIFSPLLLDPGNLAVLAFFEDQIVGDPINGSVKEHWYLNMDVLDLDLGRWFYVGQKLTFHPYCSVRGALIHQKLNAHYESNLSLTNGTVVPFPSAVYFKSHSWGVGPRIGLDAHWNLCRGFRLFSNGSADILFTRYYSCQTRGIVSIIPVSIDCENKISQKTINSLRGHFDLEMGFGWGKYFQDSRWHMDLELGYGFQIFFDQNMFRHLTTAFVVPVSTSRFVNLATTSNEPNGNLYIQGLTAKVKIDF